MSVTGPKYSSHFLFHLSTASSDLNSRSVMGCPGSDLKRLVLQRVEQLIRNERYRPEILVTFSFPLIDSIIGLELKKRYGLPWLRSETPRVAEGRTVDSQ